MPAFWERLAALRSFRQMITTKHRGPAMPRKTMTSILTVASMTALMLAAATPASAGSSGPKYCGSGAAVIGATESSGQVTYDAAPGHCGTLGVRANYVHVGGDSWTPWKYSAYSAGSVSMSTKNAVRSLHSTSIGSLLFYSYK